MDLQQIKFLARALAQLINTAESCASLLAQG